MHSSVFPPVCFYSKPKAWGRACAGPATFPSRCRHRRAVLGLLPAPGRLPAPSPTAIPPFPASRRPVPAALPEAARGRRRCAAPWPPAALPSPALPSPPVPFGPRGTHRVRGGAEVLEGQRAEDEAREQGRGALALHAPQWRPRRAARSPQRPAAAGQGRAGPGRAGSSPRVLLAMGSGSRRQGHRGFCASGTAVFGFTAHHDGR